MLPLCGVSIHRIIYGITNAVKQILKLFLRKKLTLNKQIGMGVFNLHNPIPQRPDKPRYEADD
jgi:hypothetical protein